MRKQCLSGVPLAALLSWFGVAEASSVIPPTPTATAWLGNGGYWTVGAWSNGVPASGDTVTLVGTGPQTVTFDDTSDPTFASLTVDDPSSTGAGVQLVSAHAFATTGGMTVGDVGIGQLTQMAGTTGFGLLTIGSQAGSIGTVDLTGGVMNGDAVIGDAGTGSYNNISAVHNVTGSLTLGNQASGNGSYTITGNTAQTNVAGSAGNNQGSLNGALVVGNAGAGSFIQGAANRSDPGNRVSVAGNLLLGVQSAATGSYTLNTGTLSVGGSMLVGAGMVGAGMVGVGMEGVGMEGADGSGMAGAGGTGTFTQAGGTAAITGAMHIGAAGSVTLTGGSLAAGSIVNDNAMVLSAGYVTASITNNGAVTTNAGQTMSVNGVATNNGTWSVSAGSTLNQSGGFTNNGGGTLSVDNSTATFGGGSATPSGGGAAINNAGGTIEATGSAIVFAGGLTNNGAYVSDSSTNTFSSLTVGPAGTIDASPGDRYVVTGSAGFVNNSTNAAQWNTAGATLEFAGTGTQTLGLNASNSAGLSGVFASAFAWQTLAIDAGAVVTLAGGAAVSDNALYLASLTGLLISGLDVTNIDGNGFDIFYLPGDDPALDAQTYDLTDGGYLIPIEAPALEPSRLTLLAPARQQRGLPVPAPVAAPEPGSLTLLASALGGLGWWRRRRQAPTQQAGRTGEARDHRQPVGE
jgi:hypothetical protein